MRPTTKAEEVEFTERDDQVALYDPSKPSEAFIISDVTAEDVGIQRQ